MPSLRARLAIILLAITAGCVTVDGTLKPDGSGTLGLVYRTPAKATEASERQRFTSGHVKVDSLTLKSGGTTTLKVSFDDVTKLSTASGFKDVTVVRSPEEGAEKVTVTLKNPNPVDIKDDTPHGPTFNFTLPGRVLEANRNATVIGDRVTWTFGLREYAKQSSVDLVTRYAAAPAGKESAPGKSAEPGK
jgi:hypothetical protein